MIKYLRLVRFPNLLIIMLTQILVRYCLVLPAFKAEYFVTGIFPEYLSNLNFYLLIISTVHIAAAGYIINDYFDRNIDEINRPGKNIVGTYLSERSAKNLYFILSSIGVLAGFYVSMKITRPVIGLLPLFSAISLWMYSSYYKRRLFSGNILVASLCALTVLITGLYEPNFYRNFIYLLWFAVPAFLLTLIRELIKDMEDIDGDERSQCKTAPIILGINKTKRVVIFLVLLMASYLILILHKYFYINKVISFWYLAGLFTIPLMALIYLVASAEEKKDYTYASLFSKLLMVGGLSSIFLFWYYFLK